MLVKMVGSARFKPWFDLWRDVLIGSGHQVFARSELPVELALQCGEVTERSARMEVSRADAILVVNPFGYLGAGSVMEVESFHRRLPRAAMFSAESWGKGCGIGSPGGKPYEQIEAAATRYGVRDAVSPISTVWWKAMRPGDELLSRGSTRSALMAYLRETSNGFKGMPKDHF